MLDSFTYFRDTHKLQQIHPVIIVQINSLDFHVVSNENALVKFANDWFLIAQAPSDPFAELIKRGGIVVLVPKFKGAFPIWGGSHNNLRGKSQYFSHAPNLGWCTRPDLVSVYPHQPCIVGVSLRLSLSCFTQFCSHAVGGKYEKDKQRLANIMAFGEDIGPESVASQRRSAALQSKKMEQEQLPVDRFTESLYNKWTIIIIIIIFVSLFQHLSRHQVLTRGLEILNLCSVKDNASSLTLCFIPGSWLIIIARHKEVDKYLSKTELLD